MEARIKKLVNGKFLPQVREDRWEEWENVDRDTGYEWSEYIVSYSICNTYEQALGVLGNKGVSFQEMIRDAEEVREFPTPEPDKIIVVEPVEDEDVDEDARRNEMAAITEKFFQKIRTKISNGWGHVKADWQRMRSKN